MTALLFIMLQCNWRNASTTLVSYQSKAFCLTEHFVMNDLYLIPTFLVLTQIHTDLFWDPEFAIVITISVTIPTTIFVTMKIHINMNNLPTPLCWHIKFHEPRVYMGQYTRFPHLSHWQASGQASLCICANLPGYFLLTYTKYGCR